MSTAELRARNIFNSMHLANMDEDVRKQLMVLLLTVPPKKSEKKEGNKKQALARLSGCISLPDDFDYKKELTAALEEKYL